VTEGWYGFVYRTMYLLGLRVWEREDPLADVVELVEGRAPLPVGRALEIGCGTGVESVYLAAHGWDVTGVDLVPRALSIARRRAARAGVTPRFLEGDATRLRDLGVGEGYTLLLDFGCFHTIPPDRRDAYAASVSAVAAPGATFLLYGFTRPPRFAPMAASMSTDEVERHVGAQGWRLESAEPVPAAAIDARQRGGAVRFGLWRYRLRRAPVAAAPGAP
jgi:SAM-dependent methyltransferase